MQPSHFHFCPFSLELIIHLLIVPAVEAEWAQWAKTPRDPDRRSPCPPHLLPLPSTLHDITENTQSHQIRDNDELWSLLEGSWVWFGQKWVWNCVWYKPLLPSEIRSCSPFSTRVRLPIATLSCMTLRLWLVLSMGSWCWDSQTEKMLTWTHGTMSEWWLVWETHQWLVQSGELHEVWCEDALLVALDDRWLLWNQPQSILLKTKRDAVSMWAQICKYTSTQPDLLHQWQ